MSRDDPLHWEIAMWQR